MRLLRRQWKAWGSALACSALLLQVILLSLTFPGGLGAAYVADRKNALGNEAVSIRRDEEPEKPPVDAYERPLDRVSIKRIAIQLLKLGIVQANRGR